MIVKKRKRVEVADSDVFNPVMPPTDLLEEDGEPLESFWHRAQIGLLISILDYRFRDRDDFVVGGNQFIYYSSEQAETVKKTKGRTKKAYKGPDFFYVSGAPRHKERRFWAVWDEGGRYPQVIIELLSPKTKNIDRTVKKDVYEQIFRTPEYYLFDPGSWHLIGWCMTNSGSYEPAVPDERGWFWSQQLGLWLGKWEGTYLGMHTTWLRFYDKDGKLVPLAEEAEKERAETEKQRAETEKQRAETEKQRADAADAEIARLKARVAQLEKKKNGR